MFSGPADRLGGEGVAEAPQGGADGGDQCAGGHDVPQGTEVLPHVRGGLLHGLPHRLRGHLGVVPRPPGQEGECF